MTTLSTHSKDAFLTAAQNCLGTPFHHQGRQPSVGLDCIGLVIVALRAAGVEVNDQTNYGLRPDGKSLVSAILDHGFVSVANIQAGDLLVFRYDGHPQHVAIATSDTRMIHSFAPAGCVVETETGAYWRRRFVNAYRLFAS